MGGALYWSKTRSAELAMQLEIKTDAIQSYAQEIVKQNESLDE